MRAMVGTSPLWVHGFWRAAACLAVTAFAASAFAQAPSAGDGAAPRQEASAEAERGLPTYRASCGFCHGADGGGGQGPALTASAFFTADDKGKSLIEFLKVGRPATGMPPFPTLAAPDVSAIHAFVRTRASGRRVRPRLNPASIVVGDAARGRAYFEGAGGCARCHSAQGDLKGVGSRFDPLILQGRMLNPRVVGLGRGSAARPPKPAQVKVTMPGGRVVTGDLVQVNDFFVTLIDSAGVRRSIPRDNETPKVEINDPVDAHRQQMKVWTDGNMHDVTAYLVSLK